eukprot:jgi/Bigna1/77539/fgenesh1_pg.48_\
MQIKSEKKRATARRPPLPVVDMEVGVQNLPCMAVGGVQTAPEVVFRVKQRSRPLAYESEEQKGTTVTWKRCQFSAAKINFAEDIGFEVVDMSTGYPDVIATCAMQIFDLLTMGGDHEVLLKLLEVSNLGIADVTDDKFIRHEDGKRFKYMGEIVVVNNAEAAKRGGYTTTLRLVEII